jgi:hypothetical protein
VLAKEIFRVSAGDVAHNRKGYGCAASDRKVQVRCSSKEGYGLLLKVCMMELRGLNDGERECNEWMIE